VKYPKGTTEHPINKSGKRKILVSVWDFGAVHPQSERSHYVCNDHPAKMRPSLARAILQLYGESPVLDPMAGIGTSLVEAMLLGMDAVGVEYEQKFVDQANTNIEHVRETFPNAKLGRAVCVQGDARGLALGKKKIKSILFSPPYFDALSMNKGGGSMTSILHEETTRDLQVRRSGPFAAKKNLPTPYSSKDGNIGNLSEFGSIEKGLHSKSGVNVQNVDDRTYMSEMLKVYRECYRVLNPGKFMVVVVKDIQRNWKTIPLGADTIILC
jgi:tRNA G10  N-methylase Trm11